MKDFSVHIVSQNSLIYKPLMYVLNQDDSFKTTEIHLSIDDILKQKLIPKPDVIIVDLYSIKENIPTQIRNMKNFYSRAKIIIIYADKMMNFDKLFSAGADGICPSEMPYTDIIEITKALCNNNHIKFFQKNYKLRKYRGTFSDIDNTKK